jgi:hypothetical protein
MEFRMTIKWSWNGLALDAAGGGGLTLRGPATGVTLSNEQLVALADVLAALAGLADADAAKGETHHVSAPPPAGADKPLSAPARKAPAKSDAKANAASKTTEGAQEVVDLAAAAAAARQVDASDPGRSRQGTTIRVEGKAVKRGPRAAGERYAASAAAPSASAAPTSAATEAAPAPAAAPAAKRRGRPRKEKAEKSTPAQTAELTAEDAELPDVVQQILLGLDKRARLLGPLIRWMARQHKPVTMDQIAAAAIEGKWSSATNPAPTLTIALQRQRHLFVKNPDKTYALRVLLPEARVVRRRSRVDG